MVDTVTVPASTPGAEDFNEEEHNAAMVAKAEAGTTITGQEEAPKLAGKFESTEDLEKAYLELQSKLGQPKEETKTEDLKMEEGRKAEESAKEVVEAAGLSMSALNSEYAENGKLTAASYEALEKAGIPRTTVNEYIAGQEALAEMYTNSVVSEVGGMENYSDLVSWAADNMSEAEINAFNNAVEGDVNQARLAVRGLKASFEAANGSEPYLRTGEAQGSGASSNVFRSTAELVRAMSDPKYSKDPAYRADVAAKLSRSSIL